ncbi:hypothetical protein BKA57DRAFT_462960 [Linnemannia elongata]|nr:hypothetical protein BKA57DRAFT_462960 [Linnemannia elongata]
MALLASMATLLSTSVQQVAAYGQSTFTLPLSPNTQSNTQPTNATKQQPYAIYIRGFLWNPEIRRTFSRSQLPFFHFAGFFWYLRQQKTDGRTHGLFFFCSSFSGFLLWRKLWSSTSFDDVPPLSQLPTTFFFLFSFALFHFLFSWRLWVLLTHPR